MIEFVVANDKFNFSLKKESFEELHILLDENKDLHLFLFGAIALDQLNEKETEFLRTNFFLFEASDQSLLENLCKKFSNVSLCSSYLKILNGEKKFDYTGFDEFNILHDLLNSNFADSMIKFMTIDIDTLAAKLKLRLGAGKLIEPLTQFVNYRAEVADIVNKKSIEYNTSKYPDSIFLNLYPQSFQAFWISLVELKTPNEKIETFLQDLLKCDQFVQKMDKDVPFIKNFFTLIQNLSKGQLNQLIPLIHADFDEEFLMNWFKFLESKSIDNLFPNLETQIEKIINSENSTNILEILRFLNSINIQSSIIFTSEFYINILQSLGGDALKNI